MPYLARRLPMHSQVPVRVPPQSCGAQRNQSDDVGKLGHRLGAEPRSSWGEANSLSTRPTRRVCVLFTHRVLSCYVWSRTHDPLFAPLSFFDFFLHFNYFCLYFLLIFLCFFFLSLLLFLPFFHIGLSRSLIPSSCRKIRIWKDCLLHFSSFNILKMTSNFHCLAIPTTRL